MQENTARPLARRPDRRGGPGADRAGPEFRARGSLESLCGRAPARMAGLRAAARADGHRPIRWWAGTHSPRRSFTPAFLINVWIGSRFLRDTESPLEIGSAAAAGSVQFFLISNFGVWLKFPQSYAHTPSGLAACYVTPFRSTAARWPRTCCIRRRCSACMPGSAAAWRGPSWWRRRRSVKTLLAWSSGKDSAWTRRKRRVSHICLRRTDVSRAGRNRGWRGPHNRQVCLCGPAAVPRAIMS